MLLSQIVGFLMLYGLQPVQYYLPFNPQGQTGISPDSSFNTAVSLVTNTNWQSYTPETTMSYLAQMAGLTVQNFVSAAVGIVLSVALIRGFARRSAKSIGNFWVDVTRCILYILLPISIIGALVLVWQGVPQNLGAYTEAATLEGAKQVIAQGPVASQEIIKELGTNGGGFFNANSAHPFENPNPGTNLIEMVAIFAIGVGLTNVFGRMGREPGLGDPRGDGLSLYRRRRRLLLGRAPRQPAIRRARRRQRVVGDADGRQHGGQGGPLRDRQLGLVGDDHH